MAIAFLGVEFILEFLKIRLRRYFFTEIAFLAVSPLVILIFKNLLRHQKVHFCADKLD